MSNNILHRNRFRAMSLEKYDDQILPDCSRRKKVQDALNLKAVKQERLLINSFGNALDELRTVDLVELTACSIFDDFQVDISYIQDRR